MGIREDFKPYFNRFGLIDPENPDGSVMIDSGNGLRYTAEYMLALVENNELNYLDKFNINAAYDACQVQPGLMKRHPEHPNQEGPDDYFGCGLMSYLSNPFGYGSLAERILAYGESGVGEWDEGEDERKRWYSKLLYLILSLGGLRNVKRVYNNVRPGKFNLSAWLGRFPQLFAHLKFACGQKPTLIEKLTWIVSLVMATRRDHSDEWCITWEMCIVAEGQSPLCDYFIKYFKSKCIEKYGKPNPSHLLNNAPLRKWLANVE